MARRRAERGKRSVDVLPRCTRWAARSAERRFSGEDRARARDTLTALTRRGCAWPPDRPRSTGTSTTTRIQDLVFLGFLAIADPVRPTAAAVADLRAAGASVVMVTGDRPVTAEGIAAELGLLNDRMAAETI